MPNLYFLRFKLLTILVYFFINFNYMYNNKKLHRKKKKSINLTKKNKKYR